MKRFAAALIIAAIVFAAAGAARAARDDDARIGALERQFAAAVNAKDINAIMKVYAPGKTLFVFDVVPPRQYVGAAAYRADWEHFLELFKGPVKFTITDLQIDSSGALGYSHSIQRISGTDAKNQPIDLTVRLTDIYRKINGRWLIVHEHISVPVDLDTDKPDLASKP